MYYNSQKGLEGPRLQVGCAQNLYNLYNASANVIDDIAHEFVKCK